MRVIPMFLYVAAMIWCAMPEHERKAGRMFVLMQRIKFHRAVAQAHGEEVIRLENLYKEECPA